MSLHANEKVLWSLRAVGGTPPRTAAQCEDVFSSVQQIVHYHIDGFDIVEKMGKGSIQGSSSVS